MTDITIQLQTITHPGLFAEVIRKEVKIKPAETLKMIREQITDNRLLMCEIVGENLVTVIENMPS